MRGLGDGLNYDDRNFGDAATVTESSACPIALGHQKDHAISWVAITGATHYDARYRDRDAGGPNMPGDWSQVDNIQGTSYTLTRLSSSTRYEFEVRAGNAAGSSGWSPNRYATTTAAPPPPPPPPPPTDTPTPTPTATHTPTATAMPVPLPPAPQNVRSFPHDLDAIQLRWDTLVDSTTNQLQVVEYMVRLREVGEAWVFHNRHIAATPPSEGRIVQYILDGLWDCDKTYEFEVSGRGDGINYDGTRYGDTTITAPTHSLCPSTIGHQADNMVYWYEDKTAYPPEDPLPPLPDYVENPYTVFDNNVSSSASKWNNIGGVTVSECSGQDDCATTTEITSQITSSSSICEGAAACFDPVTTGSPSSRSGFKPRHITGGVIYFVLFEPDYNTSVHGQNAYWTGNSSIHGDKVPDGTNDTVYHAVKSAILHEFGHAVGLGHIPVYPSQTIMNSGNDLTSPTSLDRRHAKALYHGHSSH